MTRTILLLLVVFVGCSKSPQFTAEEIADHQRTRNFYELPEGTDPNDLEWVEVPEPFFVAADGTRYTITDVPKSMGTGKSLGISKRVRGLPDTIPDPPKRSDLPPEVLAECERHGIEIPVE